MTTQLSINRYWRIPTVALIAAVLAFGASYIEKPAYVATARILMVEGSASLLNGSGQPVSNPLGVDGATSAQTLSETQAGLASSRAVATIVVDALHLAAPKPAKHGILHSIVAAAAGAYAHVKAWLTHGFYTVPNHREQVIQATEAAIVVSDLAPSGGPDTGQSDSYVLELDASGSTALQSAAIANTAANALISVSQQRFAQDSRYFATSLARQLGTANATLAGANRAVSNYELAHNISSFDQQLTQNILSSGTLSAQLTTARAAVQGDEQTVASLQATLAGTDPTETVAQSITTGRSTTADNTTQANPVYQTVEEQLGQARAALARDTATVSALQGEVSANPSSHLTQAQAGLLSLEQKVTADQDAVQSLSQSLQAARASEAVSPVQLSRLGGVNVPTYPSSPKRELYLLLGLLIGALAGWWLTLIARRRRMPAHASVEPAADVPLAGEDGITAQGPRRPQEVPVGAPTGAAVDLQRNGVHDAVAVQHPGDRHEVNGSGMSTNGHVETLTQTRELPPSETS